MFEPTLPANIRHMMEDENSSNIISRPTQWKDYELIDSGHFEKLERFGPYLIARPEPQALWNKSLSEAE